MKALAAGLAAALVAFGVVMLASDGDDAPPTGPPAPPQSDGARVFAGMGCGGCHRLAAARSTGEIGPDLDAALASHTAESLEAKIASPTPGTAMPSDFAERMSAAEMDALVSFLLASRRSE